MKITRKVTLLLFGAIGFAAGLLYNGEMYSVSTVLFAGGFFVSLLFILFGALLAGRAAVMRFKGEILRAKELNRHALFCIIPFCTLMAAQIMGAAAKIGFL